MTAEHLSRWLPCARWLRRYNRSLASQDALAAVIVTLMLIPQSLAYAMLAGLPPITGLYASMLPLLLYTLFGTSNTLAVGPVAVVSLMTAAALQPLFPAGSADYVAAAMLLALMSGAILLGMAALKLGFIANFLSHPVISGFISASGILIALGQLRHLLGLSVSGDNALNMLVNLWQALPDTHLPTLLIGAGSLALLYLARFHFKSALSVWAAPRPWPATWLGPARCSPCCWPYWWSACLAWRTPGSAWWGLSPLVCPAWRCLPWMPAWPCSCYRQPY